MSLIRSGQSLDDFLSSFWTSHLHHIENEDTDFKKHELPLARIKKVMKSDPSVKMISGEAPILFSKACEIFISELTCRSWLVAESNKRRTLQRADVAGAVELSDQFDFLIDIIPRGEDSKKRSKNKVNAEAGSGGGGDYGVQQEQHEHEQVDQQHDFTSDDTQDAHKGPLQEPLNYTDQTHNDNDPAVGYLPYETDFLLNMIGSSPNNPQHPGQGSAASGSDNASI